MKEKITERKKRIEVINRVIQEIATRGRKFLSNKENGIIGQFKMLNDRVIYVDPYTGYKLTTFGSRDADKFSHGGTLWGLLCDFRLYIMNGKDTNGANGYGGLYCPHWGYSEEDMRMIRAVAREVGYLI